MHSIVQCCWGWRGQRWWHRPVFMHIGRKLRGWEAPLGSRVHENFTIFIYSSRESTFGRSTEKSFGRSTVHSTSADGKTRISASANSILGRNFIFPCIFPSAMGFFKLALTFLPSEMCIFGLLNYWNTEGVVMKNLGKSEQWVKQIFLLWIGDMGFDNTIKTVIWSRCEYLKIRQFWVILRATKEP